MDDDLLTRMLALVAEVGPGGRISSERELTEQWGTSRTALRTRFRMLEALGALERRGAAGTFARVMMPEDVAAALAIGLSGSPLASARAFESVRTALEREAAGRAASELSPIAIGHAEEALLRMESTTDPAALYQADLDFHRALFDASNDPALQFFSEAVSGLLAASVSDRRARIRALTDDTAEMRRLHRSILDAVRTGISQQAMAAVDDHFSRIDRMSAPI